jgi:hypothetical protein
MLTLTTLTLDELDTLTLDELDVLLINGEGVSQSLTAGQSVNVAITRGLASDISVQQSLFATSPQLSESQEAGVGQSVGVHITKGVSSVIEVTQATERHLTVNTDNNILAVSEENVPEYSGNAIEATQDTDRQITKGLANALEVDQTVTPSKHTGVTQSIGVSQAVTVNLAIVVAVTQALEADDNIKYYQQWVNPRRPGRGGTCQFINSPIVSVTLAYSTETLALTAPERGDTKTYDIQQAISTTPAMEKKVVSNPNWRRLALRDFSFNFRAVCFSNGVAEPYDTFKDAAQAFLELSAGHEITMTIAYANIGQADTVIGGFITNPEIVFTENKRWNFSFQFLDKVPV